MTALQDAPAQLVSRNEAVVARFKKEKRLISSWPEKTLVTLDLNNQPVGARTIS